MKWFESIYAIGAFIPVVLSSAPSSIPQRPSIEATPYNTGRSQPDSPPRDKDRYCFVQPSSDGEDDAPVIFKAFQECNDGGTVVLDQVYQIGSPLDITFLRHVDVVITGEIHFDDRDVYYWAENSFKFDFQNQSTFWKWGGEDINIYGDLSNDESVIDGHGQAYWEEIQTNKTLLRPMLFAFDGMHQAVMSNLRMRNPPNWFNLIANSTDILISNMHLNATSLDDVEIANSDGWDTYRSDRVVIQDSIIKNTDGVYGPLSLNNFPESILILKDCVSFKPNSTNVVVQDLKCTGSHGISVGSLGQYKDRVDIVENLYIYNISMTNASDGARIKVWPGIETDFQDNLNGGGGLGRVKNVTYDTFYHENNDRAITLTQCYGSSDEALCYEFPANLTIEDITFRNMWGTVSDEEDPQAGTLVCSAPDRCDNIRAENITIEVPSGEAPVYECVNLDEGLLDFTCVDSQDDQIFRKDRR
ncbi:hypothetical protein FQN54_002319 [Arachnomyces sp. PD_36]|nr:hypothetical protein FQN54_002319 [Arachnomyces sp. PD_36]